MHWFNFATLGLELQRPHLSFLEFFLMSPILLDTVGPLSCGSPSTSIAFRAVNARYSFFLDTKRREAQVKDAIPPNAQDVAKCLVTGDSATESPIHLCHVFHERYWSNHPMVSRLREMSLASRLIYATLSSYRVSNGHGA